MNPTEYNEIRVSSSSDSTSTTASERQVWVKPTLEKLPLKQAQTGLVLGGEILVLLQS